MLLWKVDVEVAMECAVWSHCGAATSPPPWIMFVQMVVEGIWKWSFGGKKRERKSEFHATGKEGRVELNGWKKGHADIYWREVKVKHVSEALCGQFCLHQLHRIPYMSRQFIRQRLCMMLITGDNNHSETKAKKKREYEEAVAAAWY